MYREKKSFVNENGLATVLNYLGIGLVFVSFIGSIVFTPTPETAIIMSPGEGTRCEKLTIHKSPVSGDDSTIEGSVSTPEGAPQSVTAYVKGFRGFAYKGEPGNPQFTFCASAEPNVSPGKYFFDVSIKGRGSGATPRQIFLGNEYRATYWVEIHNP